MRQIFCKKVKIFWLLPVVLLPVVETHCSLSETANQSQGVLSYQCQSRSCVCCSHPFPAHCVPLFKLNIVGVLVFMLLLILLLTRLCVHNRLCCKGRSLENAGGGTWKLSFWKISSLLRIAYCKFNGYFQLYNSGICHNRNNIWSVNILKQFMLYGLLEYLTNRLWCHTYLLDWTKKKSLFLQLLLRLRHTARF